MTLASLHAALAASPDNAALAAVLIKAHLERGELERAKEVLGERPPSVFAESDCTTMARLLLAAGDPQRALLFAAGSSGESALMRARAHAALGQRTEAKDAYQQAVTLNPTLEDLDLKAQVLATVKEVQAQQGPRLRVIANDDTDATELNRILAPPQPPLTFADVGGLEQIKTQINKRIILPFQKPSLFEKFKKRSGGGILLYGPPGCGKTLLARATAGECKASFFSIAISDVLDMYIGESERKLHALFEKARQSAPAVMFFDELEALAAKRQYSREGTASKLVSQFLSEMDGFVQQNAGVLILGATNVPWVIDPAFRRPGRFDRVLFVPPPDAPARLEILRLLLKDRPQQGNLDLDFVVRATSGFTGADLSAVVETASDHAIEQSLQAGVEQPITGAHLKAALKEVKPTALEWLTTARNYARYANEGGQYDEVLEFLNANGRA